MAANTASPLSRFTSYFSSLNPTPSFPAYTGPYKVGTVDVEIPITDLEPQSEVPENTPDIETVLLRIYYPALPDSKEPFITWVPEPQRQQISGYSRFLGLGSRVSEFVSFLPRHLYYATIPVHQNATLHKPPAKITAWPTMIFSHGLGGSRNSYSYVAGSLASHGMVVVCPEHRDGSAVASPMRQAARNGDHSKGQGARILIPYQKYSHTPCQETYAGRSSQLKIRLWELGLAHSAVLALNDGRSFTNLDTTTPNLNSFAETLRVREPGSIIFGGHSYGSTTTVHFLKSTFHAGSPKLAQMRNPLFVPKEGSQIRKQITENTPTMLLDLWCMPFLIPDTLPLVDLPLPAYADTPSAPGGKAILAVESEAFVKWNEHLHLTALAISPNPAAKVVTTGMFERKSGTSFPQPNLFYVINSAHLNQSDFGILFPWLTKRMFQAVEPERVLRLNLRAQLQFLRQNGVPVAQTCSADMVDGPEKSTAGMQSDGSDDDSAILDKRDGLVGHWKAISTIGLGAAREADTGKSVGEQVEEGEQHMKGEIEPSEKMSAMTEGRSNVTDMNDSKNFVKQDRSEIVVS